MIELTDLNLSYNSLRVLPNELGRLFRLKNLGLQGNPLPAEVRISLDLINDGSGMWSENVGSEMSGLKMSWLENVGKKLGLSTTGRKISTWN